MTSKTENGSGGQAPDLDRLAKELHQALESASPAELHSFFTRLRDLQPEDTAAGMNEVRYEMQCFVNLFHRRMQESEKTKS